MSLSVHQPFLQTDLHPPWNVLLWVSESPSSGSSSLLQDLGCAVLSLHVVVQQITCMLHWITVESREAHVPREWPLHMSLREAEVSILRSQFSIPGISHKSVPSSAVSHTAPSALPYPHTAPPPLSLLSFLSLHGCLPHHSRPLGGILTPSCHGFYLTHEPSWGTTSLQIA